MLFKRCVSLMLFAIALVPATAYSSTGGYPVGAFARKSVSTPEQLSLVVKNDSAAAARYSRHYHMPASVIAAYFRDNLKVSTLSHSGTYTVYFVSNSGRVYSHRVYMRAKEAIFSTKDGVPVIVVKCGNPMTQTLPGVKNSQSVRSGSSAVVSKVAAYSEAKSFLPESSLLDASGDVASAESGLKSLGTQPFSSDTSELITPEFETSAVAGIQQVSQLTSATASALTGSAGISGLTGVLGGLAAGAVGATIANRGSRNIPAPTPEPSTVLSLGVLVLPALGLFKKKSKF